MVGKVAGSGYAQAIANLQRTQAPAKAQEAAKASSPGFGDTLKAAVASVDKTQTTADGALKELASGENVDLHGTMIALEKADIALRTMVSVRDKLVSAYEQVMSTTI